MTKPTFIGIGTQRAGTTFLHTLLSRHEEIYMPTTGNDRYGKEIHFFNSTVQYEGFADYEAHFADADPSKHKAMGEITPAYVTMPKYLVEQVARYLGKDTKIILVVRDPVERVISHFKMTETRFHRQEISDDLISLDRVARFTNEPLCRLRTEYRRAWQIWSDVFGKDNVLVVSYEDMTRDTANTLRRIFAHIGVDTAMAEPIAATAERVYGSKGEFKLEPGVRGYLAERWRDSTSFVRENTQAEGAFSPKVEETSGSPSLAMKLRHLPRRVLREVHQSGQMAKKYLRLRKLLAERNA